MKKKICVILIAVLVAVLGTSTFFKTRDVVKGTIKKIDKAAIAADRMRSAYVQTKEKAEHTTHPDEHNAEEYASDRVEGGIDRITHEAAHQFDKQGRKGLEETKRNVSKAKDGVQRFREKRAAESMKRQTVRTSGNKTIKAVEQTEKTIKQSARSAGKKTIKTAGKGTAKAAQRSVKTTKTAIKTTQQAAKAAQKTAQATVKASQKAAQAAKAAAKATVAGVKAAVKATIAAVKAIIAATKALVAAIAAGGWVAVAVIVVCTYVGCEEYRPSEHPAQSHTLSAHHHNEHSGQFLHHNSVRHGKVYYSGQCNQTLHQTYAVPKKMLKR